MTKPEPLQTLPKPAKEMLYQAIVDMDISNMYLVDKSQGSNGFDINISRYSPALALIFKTMLLTAIDGLSQKLTIEFDDFTACTTLNHSKLLKAESERE